MSLKVDANKNAFLAKWILTRQQITTLQPLSTELQTIEGMPDVKWFLKWNYARTLCSLSITIESKSEIEYTIYRHQCSSPKQTDVVIDFLVGKKDIELITNSGSSFIQCLKNDELTIIIRGCFSYTQKSKPDIKITNAAEWGLRLKESMNENFDVVVDGQTIKIHKPFLASESPVFAKMFEDNFKEAKECKVTIIDFKYKIVQAAINYCYGQNINELIEDDMDEIELLYFCDKYDCQTLKPKFEQHLIQKLTAENLTFYVSNVDQTNALLLRQACINLICGLIDRKESNPNIDMKTFDKAFMADVLQQLMNRGSSSSSKNSA